MRLPGVELVNEVMEEVRYRRELEFVGHTSSAMKFCKMFFRFVTLLWLLLLVSLNLSGFVKERGMVLSCSADSYFLIALGLTSLKTLLE